MAFQSLRQGNLRNSFGNAARQLLTNIIIITIIQVRKKRVEMAVERRRAYLGGTGKGKGGEEAEARGAASCHCWRQLIVEASRRYPSVVEIPNEPRRRTHSAKRCTRKGRVCIVSLEWTLHTPVETTERNVLPNLFNDATSHSLQNTRKTIFPHGLFASSQMFIT